MLWHTIEQGQQELEAIRTEYALAADNFLYMYDNLVRSHDFLLEISNLIHDVYGYLVFGETKAQYLYLYSDNVARGDYYDLFRRIVDELASKIYNEQKRLVVYYLLQNTTPWLNKQTETGNINLFLNVIGLYRNLGLAKELKALTIEGAYKAYRFVLLVLNLDSLSSYHNLAYLYFYYYTISFEKDNIDYLLGSDILESSLHYCELCMDEKHSQEELIIEYINIIRPAWGVLGFAFEEGYLNYSFYEALYNYMIRNAHLYDTQNVYFRYIFQLSQCRSLERMQIKFES